MSLTTASIRQQQHPLIRQVADSIESIWQRYLDLSPYDLPNDLEYVEGRLEGEKRAIGNRCCQTPQFRKLHLELVRVRTTLDILYCVVFPRSEYALPMFGADLVSGRGQISMAVTDLSPVSSDHSLPSDYQSLLTALPNAEFVEVRNRSTWGTIFSDFCVLVRSANRGEETQFLASVKKFLEFTVSAPLLRLPFPLNRLKSWQGNIATVHTSSKTIKHGEASKKRLAQNRLIAI